MTVTLAEYTKAWQLYLGLFFILMVMYAPGGLASLLMMNLRIAAHGMMRRILPSGMAVMASAFIAVSGAIVLIEMLYHWSLEAVNNPAMSIFGVAIDTARPTGWLAGAALLLLGALSFRLTQPPFAHAWGEANAEIERLEARRPA